MIDTNVEISKAIIRSQHCQRNWDLSREIPEADLNLFITALTQCPSKQNIAHYKVHAITNRAVIEEIHNNTRGFGVDFNPANEKTNSQVLANLLVVFEYSPVQINSDYDKYRTYETLDLANGTDTEKTKYTLMKDCHMAVGVAAGYLNVVASMLGYSTGCCACYNNDPIQKLLGADNEILLMMGVGFKNPEVNRRVHHLEHDFIFPTKVKQPIRVKHWN